MARFNLEQSILNLSRCFMTRTWPDCELPLAMYRSPTLAYEAYLRQSDWMFVSKFQ